MFHLPPRLVERLAVRLPRFDFRALDSDAATACFSGCPAFRISAMLLLTTFLEDPRLRGTV